MSALCAARPPEFARYRVRGKRGVGVWELRAPIYQIAHVVAFFFSSLLISDFISQPIHLSILMDTMIATHVFFFWSWSLRPDGCCCCCCYRVLRPSFLPFGAAGAWPVGRSYDSSCRGSRLPSLQGARVRAYVRAYVRQALSGVGLPSPHDIASFFDEDRTPGLKERMGLSVSVQCNKKNPRQSTY